MEGNKIYVQGSYIDIHDNERVYLSVDKAKVRLADEPQQEAPQQVPELLAGCVWWQRLREAGLVDEAGLPTVSRTEAALMADMLAERVGIEHKWKFFESLWQRNNMRNDYNNALNQRKSLEFQERLKRIFG